MPDTPYSPARNSFHLLRLLFASLVLLCHSYTLLDLATPLNRFTSAQLNEGTLAVDGFLVISGFLICQSSLRARSCLAFLRNRALRIIPALLCATTFTAFIIGGLAYSGTYAQYLREPVNGPVSYVLNWLTLNIGGDQWNIAGVFEGSVKQGVNVSLWTLKHEVSLYLLMAALMVPHLHRRRGTYVVFYAAFLALYVLLEGFSVRLWDIPDTRWWVLSRWNYARFVETGYFFFAGTMLYAFRAYMPRRWYLAVIAVLAMVLGGIAGQLRWVYMIAWPYLVCYVGGSPWGARAERMGDLSMGLYIFGYPLQQLVYHAWGNGLHPLGNWLIASVLTLPMAGLMWRYIEEPLSRLKRANRGYK